MKNIMPFFCVLFCLFSSVSQSYDKDPVSGAADKLALEEFVNSVKTGVLFPFSFILDGKKSSEFIGSWKRNVAEKNIDSRTRLITVTYTDPKTSVEAVFSSKIYSGGPAADWIVYFTNKGSGISPTIEAVKALDITFILPPKTPPVLHHTNGSFVSREDWLPIEETINSGKKVVLAPVGGKSAQKVSPFFNVKYGNKGFITAIGWSGQWTAALENVADSTLKISAGMETIKLKLLPGEKIRTPRIMLLFYKTDDIQYSYNLFRKVMFDNIMPKKDGKPLMPPIVHLSTSFYEENKSTEANVLSHLDSIKGLGFEYFWLDAYWTKDGFPNGMGNYGFPIDRVEPKDRFPQGIKPIGDAAHKEKMGFVLWFEPERTMDGTFIEKEHPEWLIRYPEGGPCNLFNLGNPEAREYMTKYFVAVVKTYGMDCLRTDYCFDPLVFWKRGDSADTTRTGITEIRYVEGLYRMWDDILAQCPGLFIDNCAGGGMRIDLETCSRSIPLWRTDATITPLYVGNFNEAAIINQSITAGLSLYEPINTSGMMGAEPYYFRSGFNGGISFAEDCRVSGYPKDLLAKGIAEGKRLRKYYYGNLYHLSEITVSTHGWCVLQHSLPEEKSGIIVAYRRHESEYPAFNAKLYEIDPDATYETVYYWNYEPGLKKTLTGKELQKLTMEIGDCPGSLIVEYKAVK